MILAAAVFFTLPQKQLVSSGWQVLCMTSRKSARADFRVTLNHNFSGCVIKSAMRMSMRPAAPPSITR